MSQRVFLVWHAHDLDQEDEVKLLGVYSTRDLAEARVERSRDLPGFRNYPDGFLVSEYEVDRDWWSDGFVET